MPLIDDAPFVKLLLRAETTVAACDFAGDAGLAGAMTIRHSRNRKPVRGEKPCITFIFVGDDDEQGDVGHTQDEIARTATIDMQIDLDLPTEVSDDDPTGLGLLGRVAAVAIRALRDPDGPMSTMCDWITEGSINPEDRSTPDEGRMTRALLVLYRTGSMDGNVLLAPEENL